MLKREIRFLAVGAFNTIFNWLTFIGLQWLFGADFYLVNLLLMYSIGSVVGFLLYRFFVFRVRNRWALDFIRFQSTSIIPFCANLVALPLLIHSLDMGPVIAQTIFVIASTIWSYFGHRYFSFRRSKENQLH